MRVLTRIPRLKTSHFVKLIAPCLIGLGLLVVFVPAYGAQLLLQRSVQLSSATPGATPRYTVQFTLQNSEVLGSLRFTFCSNSPIIGDVCVAPAGFDASAVNVATQFGATNFTRDNSTTNNVVILTRLAATASGILKYDMDDIVSPSSKGSYYLRIQTYASEDATGPTNDEGGLAFAIVPLVSISAEVPPYLLFCSAVEVTSGDCGNTRGNYMNFGNLSPQSSASAQSQLVAATNADNGYNISVFGTTLTSGNNVIPILAGSDVSRPGTSQFGINLRANSDPQVGADVSGPGNGVPAASYAVPNRFMLHSGDIIASGNSVEDYRKYTISYLINITRSQPAGVYVSTITYTASGNF